MRRSLLILLCMVMIILYPAEVLAVPLDFGGGVNDEYEYEEIVFISGTPIKFIGTFSVTERKRDNVSDLSYKFMLTPEDKTIEGKLDRKLSYQIVNQDYSEKGQTVAQASVKSYRETITIGEDKYTLSDYQFSKSDIIDNRPASDYYSGTVISRKLYDINKDEGRVSIETSGGSVGYKNFWGTTETQILDYMIDTERDLMAEDEAEENTTHASWQGTVRVSLSDSMSKVLNYEQNTSSLSSFTGGYIKVSKQDMYSRYDYDLPRMNEGKPHSSKRNQGTISVARSNLPRVERLIIPRLRDIEGYWAAEDIKKLYSLGIYEDTSEFFLPDVPMTRLDFVKAIVNASKLEEEVAAGTSSTSLRQRRAVKPEPSPFYDMPASSPDYSYVKKGIDKGIITGSQGYLRPNQPINRAEAITLLIRALGFEYKAPTPGYYTSFTDDRQIPSWARDSIYVAKEIGLQAGDTAGRINADQTLTRAEASSLLVRYLQFLERDLQKDYREDIVLYN